MSLPWKDTKKRVKELKDKRKYEETEQFLRERLNTARNESDPDWLWVRGAICAELGDLYAVWANYNEPDRKLLRRLAENAYHNAYVEGEREENGVNMSRGCNGLGKLARASGNFAEALSFHKTAARTLDQGEKGQSATADYLRDLSDIFKNMGEYGRAKECLILARDVSLEPMAQVWALNKLGIVYRNVGLDHEAMACFDQSLSLLETAPQGRWKKNARFYALIGKGTALSEKGDFDSAERVLLEAVELQKTLQKKVNPVTSHVLGMFYLKWDKLADAEKYIQEAAFPSGPARLCLAKGDHLGAIAHYTESLNELPADKAYGWFGAYTGLGRAHEALQDWDKAVECYEKAIEQVEGVRKRVAEHATHTAPDAQITTREEDSKELAEAFFDVTFEGFERTEPYKGLARTLMKKAAKDGEAAGLSGSTRQATGLSSVGAFDPIILESALFASERCKARTFADLLAKGRNGFTADETDEEAPDRLEETEIREDEWVLVYDVTETDLLIWLLKGLAVAASRRVELSRDELERKGEGLRAFFEVKNGEDWKGKLESFDFALAADLCKLLVRDVIEGAEIPEGQPIIVIPEGILGILPFEALVWETGPEKPEVIIEAYPENNYLKKASMHGVKFFGDRHPISYYQSLTAMTLVRRNGADRAPGHKTLVVADPVCPQDDDERYTPHETGSPRGSLTWNRLKDTRDVIEYFETTYGENATVCEGPTADKETFLTHIAPKLSEFHTIVFATHGYFGTGLQKVAEPVLLLSETPKSPDPYLRMSEVMKLRTNADIAALTACQSGLGKRVAGEGVLGMGRAFQIAGAKTLLMSLWSVEVKSAVDLTTLFFEERRHGSSKIEALRGARDQIRRTYDHPVFWAALTLTGETD